MNALARPLLTLLLCGLAGFAALAFAGRLAAQAGTRDGKPGADAKSDAKSDAKAEAKAEKSEVKAEAKKSDTGDTDLAQELKEFRTAIAARKGEKDPQAKQQIEAWLKRWEDLSPKQRAEVVSALAPVLALQRPPEQSELLRATVLALGHAGQAGAKVLQNAFDAATFDGKDWLSLRAAMLQQIGAAKDPGMVKFLVDTATRGQVHDTLLAAAGQALGSYAAADQKVRKAVFKDLFRKLVEVAEAASTIDPGDAQAQRSKERLAAIQDAWNATLAQLSGQTYREARQWQEFYNKHKDDDWDQGRRQAPPPPPRKR